MRNILQIGMILFISMSFFSCEKDVRVEMISLPSRKKIEMPKAFIEAFENSSLHVGSYNLRKYFYSTNEFNFIYEEFSGVPFLYAGVRSSYQYQNRMIEIAKDAFKNLLPDSLIVRNVVLADNSFVFIVRNPYYDSFVLQWTLDKLN